MSCIRLLVTERQPELAEQFRRGVSTRLVQLKHLLSVLQDGWGHPRDPGPSLSLVLRRATPRFVHLVADLGHPADCQSFGELTTVFQFEVAALGAKPANRLAVMQAQLERAGATFQLDRRTAHAHAVHADLTRDKKPPQLTDLLRVGASVDVRGCDRFVRLTGPYKLAQRESAEPIQLARVLCGIPRLDAPIGPGCPAVNSFVHRSIRARPIRIEA